MKNFSIIVLVIILFVSCSGKKEIPNLLEGNYITHTISFEETKPKINLEKENLKEILILLHHRKTPQEIRTHFQITNNIWNERINLLFGEGLIKKFEDSSFIPTVFVLDEENGKSLKKLTDSLGAEMSGIAIDRLNKIKEIYQQIPALKRIPFEQLSMLVLGGFVHDFEQLKIYQEQFLKAFVPSRGKTNYYLCLLQNRFNESKPKIYETRYFNYPTFKLGSFSSTIYERNIATYATSDLTRDFGKPATESDSLYQITLLNELIKMNQSPNYKPAQNILRGFEKNGIVVNGKPTIPFLKKSEMQKINLLNAAASQDIINYFENRQTLFVKWYLNSQYREETTYKEWLIWVYKMITAKTIDTLIEKTYIKTFGGNTASFICEK